MLRRSFPQSIAASAVLFLVAGAAFAQPAVIVPLRDVRPNVTTRDPRLAIGASYWRTRAMLGKQFHLGSMVGFSQKVLAYAESQIGRTVGDGQCWALVNAAIQAAGAAHPSTYVWGRALDPNEPILPGDVIQFTSCRFQWANGWMQTAPHHSAIVRSATGRTVVMIEQNANNVMSVTVSSPLDLNTLVSGQFTVYRPIAP